MLSIDYRPFYHAHCVLSKLKNQQIAIVATMDLGRRIGVSIGFYFARCMPNEPHTWLRRLGPDLQ
jgi:hypothetical protein